MLVEHLRERVPRDTGRLRDLLDRHAATLSKFLVSNPFLELVAKHGRPCWHRFMHFAQKI